MEYTNFKASNKEIGAIMRPMLKPTFTPSRSQTGWDMNRLEYQKLADRDTKCLSPDIDLNDFEIVSYDAGEHKMKPNGLTFKHFDFVSLICTSMHPIKKVEIYHFTGSRDKVITILNCKKK